jgi:hypothetical protein
MEDQMTEDEPNEEDLLHKLVEVDFQDDLSGPLPITMTSDKTYFRSQVTHF